MTSKSQQRQRAAARNEQLRKEYDAMWKKGLRSEHIFSKLSEKYFISVTTTECIVLKRGVYADF